MSEPALSASLSVEVTASRSERVPADLLVATLFAGERPLRGAAARVDWRLCGMLSAHVAAGRLGGAAGEATLLPSPRSLRSRRVLLLGLGPRSGFSAEDLLRAAAEATRRALDLRAGSVALAVPDEAATGLPADRRASAIVRGVAEALAARPFPFRLTLVVPSGELRAAAGALAELTRQPGTTAVPLRPAHARVRDEEDALRPEGGGSFPRPPSAEPPGSS